MKIVCICLLGMILIHQKPTKTFRFIGQLKESDCNDGFCWYLLVGASGTKKTFIQLDEWPTLPYNLANQVYKDKWFEISYYDVFNGLGDDEEKRWFRRISSLRLIAVPGTKLFRFTGKFQSASVLEGSGHYSFVGLNGKIKDFAYDMQWVDDPLSYNLLDGSGNANASYTEKWFEISYYQVYGVLTGNDGAPKQRHRRIYTIKLIPIPAKKNVVLTDTSTLINVDVVKGQARLTFFDHTAGYVELECDTSALDLQFRFSDRQALADQYYNHRFEFNYRIEYSLHSEIPVSRRLVSLRSIKSGK